MGHVRPAVASDSGFALNFLYVLDASANHVSRRQRELARVIEHNLVFS